MRSAAILGALAIVLAVRGARAETERLHVEAEAPVVISRKTDAEFDLRPATKLLVVEQRSRSGRLPGALMITGGTLGLVAAGVLTTLGAAWAGQDCNAVGDARPRCEALRSDGVDLRAAGFVSLGAAAVLGLAGLYLVINAGRTTVRQPEPR